MNFKRGHEWKEFNLHVRCSNCSRESGQTVSVPIGEGSPEDLEQLLALRANKSETIEWLKFTLEGVGERTHGYALEDSAF